MKILRSLALLGTILVLAAPQAQAQVELEITPFAGGTFFLADPPDRFALRHGPGGPMVVQNASFDDAWTFGLNAGVRLNERWAVEGMFSWLPTRISASGLAGDRDVNGFMYGLTGLYYFLIDQPFSPFIGLGVGAETFDYDLDGAETHTEWMGNVAGGVYFAIGERLGIRLELRDCFARFDSGVNGVDDTWENDLMTTVGLSYRIPAS